MAIVTDVGSTVCGALHRVSYIYAKIYTTKIKYKHINKGKLPTNIVTCIYLAKISSLIIFTIPIPMVFLKVTQVCLIVATVKETRERSSFSEVF